MWQVITVNFRGVKYVDSTYANHEDAAEKLLQLEEQGIECWLEEAQFNWR